VRYATLTHPWDSDRTGSRTLYYTIGEATRWIAPRLRTLALYRSADLDLVAL
jgi:asparagine synthase (glutamine-hydrolysing)